jgi:predicted phage terminase large subunit-like protein
MEALNIDWSKVDSLNGTQVKKLLSLLEPRSLKYSPHVPTPKQQVFMNLTCREGFFGGAAGGGKSDALLMDALQYSDVKGYAAIIFRRSFADLVKPGALIDRAKDWLMPFVYKNEVVWREKDRKFEFVEHFGRHTDVISILQFGYLETENDKYNYQGGEYQYAGFDELVHMSESNYRYIFSRLRRLKNVDIPIKVRGASNPPDDDQGTWVYDRFVNPKTKLPNVIFIPAGMDDNPHLDAAEYEQMLNELDPVTRARLKDGNWTIIRKGNMFKRDWFEVVEELPANRRIVRFWDMAATDAEKAKARRKNAEPDWTVGAKISEYKGIFYIEDFERHRKAPGASQEIQQNIALSDGKRVKIRMEQEPGSSGVITVDHYKKNVFPNYNFNGVRSTGSKIDRANPVSAKASKGLVKIYRNCRNIEEFFGEAESFPGGVHDDMVDGVSGAMADLMTTTPVEGQIPTIVGETTSYWDESSYS